MKLSQRIGTKVWVFLAFFVCLTCGIFLYTGCSSTSKPEGNNNNTVTPSGCNSDAECRGDRICENKICVTSKRKSTVVGGQQDLNSTYSGVVQVGAGCSGTLIDKRRVLTAGHCVCQTFSPTPAKPGVPSRMDATNCQDSVQVTLIRDASKHTLRGKVKVHPRFFMDLDAQEYVQDSGADIALVILEKAAPDIYTPIPSTVQAPAKGAGVTLVGFGLDGCKDGANSGVRRFGSNTLDEVQDDLLIISKTSENEAVTWKGDSGGALLAQMNGQQVVAGVTSLGVCGRKASYTNVATYASWIAEHQACEQARCGTECVNLKNSNKHCGRCHNPCSSGQKCQNGMCKSGTVSCGASEVDCGGVCRRINSDNEHCGRCYNRCASGQSCQSGVCKLSTVTCPTGEKDCGGFCRNTSKDNNHCGQCNNRCPSGQFCENSQCRCPGGQNYCNNRCLNISSDVNNCGSCGRKCSSNEYCSSGTCKPKSTPCAASETRCSGVCRNTSQDNNHCGRCNNPCPSAQSCRNGRCECPSGQDYCSPRCVSLNNDNSHCGRCNNRCASGQNCQNGRCQCSSGQSYCGNQCVYTTNNSSHCGRCNNRCSSGQYCQNGRCQCSSGKKYCGGGCRECCSSSDCGSGKTCSNYRCVNATPRVTGMSCTNYGKGQSASCTLTGVNFSKASSAWVSCLQISSQSRQSDNSWKLYGKWVCNCSTANRLEANVTGSSGNYTSSRSLSGSCSPQVYSVTPTTAYLNRETMFTVRGVNLPSSLAAWIDSCAGLRYGSRQSTSAIFYCKPSYSRGSKKGVIKDRSGGTLLKTFYITVK